MLIHFNEVKSSLVTFSDVTDYFAFQKLRQEKVKVQFYQKLNVSVTDQILVPLKTALGNAQEMVLSPELHFSLRRIALSGIC